MPLPGQQISPLQQRPLPSPQQFPSAMQLQTSPSYLQAQSSSAQLPQVGQIQMQNSAVQAPSGQTYSSQQMVGLNGQLPVSQPQIQHNSSSASQLSSNSNLSTPVSSSMTNQQQLPSQQPLFQSLHQPPPPLTAQMLSQQTLDLQARFQSSQQAFSQLQQQLQLIQPSVQQGSQGAKQQVFPTDEI